MGKVARKLSHVSPPPMLYGSSLTLENHSETLRWFAVLDEVIVDGLIVDGLISATATASATASATATATHPSMKEAALRAASTQGGGAKRRPPCVDSFMDGCVAVTVAEAVAEAVAVSVAETVAVAVAEINPSTIIPPTI